MNPHITPKLSKPGCLCLSVLLLTPAWAVERQSLSGHVPAVTAHLQPVGRLPGSTRLNLAIGLPLRNQEALAALLEQLYDPASPHYHHYLTPNQFAERFGPTREDYQAVIEFAKAHGLAVTGTHPNRVLLDVSGAAGQIEEALHLTLRVYQHPTEHRTFHAPDAEPSLDLAVPVLRISGLSDLAKPSPVSHLRSSAHDPGGLPRGGSGPGGGFLGNDFRAAYAPGVSLTGAGQSVALVEFDDYFPNDIADYKRLAGLPDVPLQKVPLDGFSGPPGSWNNEVALDIEMAIAMAPGLSSVIIYEAPIDTAPWHDLLNRIATDNLAKQVSCSWYTPGGGPDPVCDQIWQQMAAQGQSVFDACGDAGAYPGLVDFPGDSPYITQVGGTTLTTSGPGGAWGSETVWNLGYFINVGYCVGSGGGISTTYPIPNWQQGLSMTANHGSTARRNIPDVAMVAENIWSLFNNGDAAASWGTSASAPLWAGFTALANELAASRGQPPVGFINPAIYALGKGAAYSSAFHDIMTGNNTTTASPANFFAVPGFDLCTGWGTPSGSNLLYALALPQLLQISPATTVTASGPQGGPFSPAAQDYALTNLGGASLDWALGWDAPWLDASATSGTLPPGSTATVTLSLNAGASNLPLGIYNATLSFTNLSDGTVQSREFALAVFGPPVVISSPASQTLPDGATATFSVVAAGNGLLNYAWYKDGIFLTNNDRITGCATSTLTISNVSSADAGNYGVFVSNNVGVYNSFFGLLTIASPPTIVVHPRDQTVLPGASAKFTVGAVGTPPLAYQWFRNGTSPVSGATSSELTVRNVGPAVTGRFSVVVSNALGAVTNEGAMLAVVPVTVPEVTFTTLYSFLNSTDGANPNGLVQATNGFFYGTANSGGANGNGTLFKISTNGTLGTLHTFSGSSDGAQPRAELIQATDGNLYGTTYSGGTNYSGIVFRTSLGGAFAILHAFTWGDDGGNPFAGLIQATDGNFYGTTWGGGSGSEGTVFKMTRVGAVTALHGFVGTDGANPRSGLIQARNGDLYGITRNGGRNTNDGTVFKITTTGTLRTLVDGANTFSPRGGLVQGRDGNVYGTTANDGAHGRGTVFRIDPTGALTALHSFDGPGDGQWPVAALVEGRDGYFYGSTLYGGTYSQGTLFKMSPGGAVTTLVQFDGYNGANPSGPLIQAADGSLYGTTLNGGANGFGTVFRLDVPAPTLSIAISGSDLVLSWPSWAADLLLKQNSDLTTTNWTEVTAARVITNQQIQVILAPGPSGNTFYRLTH